MTTTNNPHIGSDFDTFLEEDDNLEAATATAIKRVIAWQIGQEMKAQHITKTAMAARMKTSRARSTVCSTKPTRASRWRRCERGHRARQTAQLRAGACLTGAKHQRLPRQRPAHDARGGVAGDPAGGSGMIGPRVAASRRGPARSCGSLRGPATADRAAPRPRAAAGTGCTSRSSGTARPPRPAKSMHNGARCRRAATVSAAAAPVSYTITKHPDVTSTSGFGPTSDSVVAASATTASTAITPRLRRGTPPTWLPCASHAGNAPSRPSAAPSLAAPAKYAFIVPSVSNSAAAAASTCAWPPMPPAISSASGAPDPPADGPSTVTLAAATDRYRKPTTTTAIPAERGMSCAGRRNSAARCVIASQPAKLHTSSAAAYRPRASRAARTDAGSRCVQARRRAPRRAAA